MLVDVRAPLIGNPVPAPASRVKSRLVEMKASLSDNPGGSGIDRSSIRFVLDGNRELSEFVYDSGSGLLSYVPASNSSELVSLEEGSHFFRVRAADLAGNQTVYDSGRFVVDYTAPLIEELLPEEGEVLSSAEVDKPEPLKSPRASLPSSSVPLEEELIDGQSIDDLNREALLKVAFFKYDSAELDTVEQHVL